MAYPVLTAANRVRETLEEFGGYNRNPRIGEGEFCRMENMTSDRFPVLSSRDSRGIYAHEAAGGLIAKDSLCYVSGSEFVMNGYRVELGLTEGEKQLVSMGAYVIILPDKKWINTLDLTDFGNIDASFTTHAAVTFTLCDSTGTALPQPAAASTPPENPRNNDLWVDTSGTASLKQYAAASGVWVTVEATWVRLSSPGMGRAFSPGDGVTVSGVLDSALADLNGSGVIQASGEDFIVLPGLIAQPVTQEALAGPVTVERRMPELDYVTQCGNRLWGCRYGTDAQGRVVNALYACKLGDFKNWNCFLGLSTDSWAASVGTDGPFTGAVTHLGHPVFFKQTGLHKVYISAAGAHQVQDTPCRGVEKGSGRSLALVGEILYYKAAGGICAYDGSLPVEVSQALGTERYRNAVGGAAGNKYYVSMEDMDGLWHLFVYDTRRGLWHREDSLRIHAFCACRGGLYAIGDGKIWNLLAGDGEERVHWMVQTGEIGLSEPNRKYISRLTLLMALGEQATGAVYIRYDLSRTWERLCTLQGTGLGLTAVPIRPRRCGYLQLKLEGDGPMRLYSVTKTVEEGSDL